MRRISILGATGSIGRSVRDVILANPGKFVVEALVGGRDALSLAETAKILKPRFVALADHSALAELRQHLSGTGIDCGAGDNAVDDAARRDADLIVAAISGFAGLRPTVAALGPGRQIALANKETLVCAGAFFMAEARRLGTTILPLDSEHNAVAQALAGRSLADVARITLTASGGPFRTWSPEQINAARREQALKHPNYSMGAKITVDSASLMNKGLELIEAHHIFGIEPARLAAVIHPEQIVHGFVSFIDGSVIAGMASPDMKVPIADCLSHGRRLSSTVQPVDLAAIGKLTFEAPDTARFPCLALAMQAMEHGGAATAVLNAADEVAVAAFLDGGLSFGQISELVSETMDKMTRVNLITPSSVEEALAIDHMTREAARTIAASRFGLRL
ncbi:MAG: 1-deoxy-D-xylulose-5-phosphate reductoisomerase [Bosea sp. (in: a-proteobacteria)]